MPYKMNLRMHFYHPSAEVSIILQPIIPNHSDPFCELLLFSSLALRQFCSLKGNPLSRLLATSLKSAGFTAEELADGRIDDEPMLVDFRGIPSSKRIIATLDVGERGGRFQLDAKGYRPLWDMNLNIDFCSSPFLLMRYLAREHRSNELYLTTLGYLSEDCADVMMEDQVTSANHLTGAYHLVKDNYWRVEKSKL